MDDDLLQMELDLVNIKIMAMETQVKAIVYQLSKLKKKDDDVKQEHVATMITERRTSLKMSKEVIRVLNKSKKILLGHGL